MSPNSRSLDKLRAEGWTVDIVERNLGRFVKKDLFGMFDLIAIRGGDTLAVQVTTSSNVSARVRKIAGSPLVGTVRKAGWRIVVHGWRKSAAGKWVCREVDCS